MIYALMRNRPDRWGFSSTTMLSAGVCFC